MAGPPRIGGLPSIGRLVVAVLALVTVAASGSAQNTSGIPGPRIGEGHRALQYRAGWDPDLDSFAQRLHYEQALHSRLMLRGIVQARKSVSSDQELDFVQAEIFVELSPEGPRVWSTGLRFDARVRERGSTGLIGLHWTNQFEITDRLSLRAMLLNFVQVGGRADDGVFPQTRLSLRRSIGRLGVGLQSFSSYGRWSALASSSRQNHQLGPFADLAIGQGWSLFGGLLLGATDASADTNLRFWLTKRF